MEPRTLAMAQAAGRVAAGVAFTAAPRRAGTSWIGADAERPGAQLLAAGLGARDLGLALGTLAAVRRGFGARPWLLAGILADAVDCAATLRHRGELSPVAAAAVPLIAGGSVALGAYLLGEVD